MKELTLIVGFLFGRMEFKESLRERSEIYT